MHFRNIFTQKLMFKANMCLKKFSESGPVFSNNQTLYCRLRHSIARILFFTAYTTAQHCFKSLLNVTNLASDAVKCLFIVKLHHPNLSLSSNVCIITIFLSLVLSYARISHILSTTSVVQLGNCCGAFHCDKF
jgi:hypothetical protein